MMRDTKQQIMRLKQMIERERRWAYSQASNERARAFHLARVAQYENELEAIKKEI